MRRSAFRWVGAGWFLIAAAVVYAGFRLGVRPGMVVEARRVEEEVARLNTSGNAGRPGSSGSDAAEATELARELTRVEERVAPLRGILATSGESEVILQSLGATASATGVRFLRFAPEPAFQLDAYLASAVAVVAEGAFVDFLRFFERISLSPHLVLMEEVAFERGSGGLLQCSFVAVTLRAVEDFVPEEPDAEAEAPAPRVSEP